MRSRAGRMALELPHSSRLCRSAGVTAGMASLAACSTRNGAFSRARNSTAIRVEGADTLGGTYKTQHWVEQRAVGGACGNAGQRLATLGPESEEGVGASWNHESCGLLAKADAIAAGKGLLCGGIGWKGWGGWRGSNPRPLEPQS